MRAMVFKKKNVSTISWKILQIFNPLLFSLSTVPPDAVVSRSFAVCLSRCFLFVKTRLAGRPCQRCSFPCYIRWLRISSSPSSSAPLKPVPNFQSLNCRCFYQPDHVGRGAPNLLVLHIQLPEIVLRSTLRHVCAFLGG